MEYFKKENWLINYNDVNNQNYRFMMIRIEQSLQGNKLEVTVVRSGMKQILKMSI